MQLVNWSLVRQPLNWATIVLMLVIAAMAGTLILHGAGFTPATADE
jgi:hypothetical protein